MASIIAPEVESLNQQALAALRAGESARAAQLLRNAAHAAPTHARTQHHLGRVLDSIGDEAGALAAQEQAIRLDPSLSVARLHYANLLQRRGSHERAVMQRAFALQDAQSRGEWLNSATTPASLKPLVEEAVRSVRSARRTVVALLMEPLQRKYGADELARVQRTLRIYFGEEKAVSPDPRQRPSFLYFPDLTQTPYPDRSMFAWIEALEQASEAITGELQALLPSTSGRETVFHNELLERENLRGVHGAPSWNGYYFYRHGERREENCVRCPATDRALQQVPLGHVRGHGPEVLFSVFTAGTHLLPHRGVTNTRLVAHLPLIVPPDCALNVGGEVHVWQPGRVVVFDDTYEHEAWNRSQHTRVVLIFDIWHPLLREAERAALTEIVATLGDFRRSVDAARVP